jgi:glutathione S-transferase
MKLYTYDAAPNGQRLNQFLKYKGIEIDTTQVDLGSGEQMGDTYKAINPYCTIPALVLDDGTLLTEVIGILTYLEESHPEPPLLGTGAKEKAQVISWVHRITMMMTSAIADVLRNGKESWKDRALPGPINVPQLPELVERGRLRLAAFYPIVDAHLAQSGYLAGEHLTFADIDLYIACGFARWVKQGIPQECEHLQAWFDKVAAELNV